MRSRQGDLRSGVSILALSVCSLWAQALGAQTRLTVDQLTTFVKSSIQLKHPDKQVAGYLLKLKMSERLDARTIEELQGLGAGPATMEGQRNLAKPPAGRTAPAPKVVKPPPRRFHHHRSRIRKRLLSGCAS